MDVDISKWHPIGWKQDFFGRPLQESVTGEIVTIDELMARYNFLLGAAQHGVQSDVAVAQQSGVNADDDHSVESPRG